MMTSEFNPFFIADDEEGDGDDAEDENYFGKVNCCIVYWS